GKNRAPDFALPPKPKPPYLLQNAARNRRENQAKRRGAPRTKAPLPSGRPAGLRVCRSPANSRSLTKTYHKIYC
ncbi:hypothetical protein EJB05_12855, partial [Eragrostis curvula]